MSVGDHFGAPYANGLSVCHDLLQESQRDFITVSLGISDRLAMPIGDLRPFLRTWYNTMRTFLEDSDQSIIGMSTSDEVDLAMSWLKRWTNNAPKPEGGSGNYASDIDAGSPSEAELRALMGLALTAPTPDAIMNFTGFVSRMRRFAPFNVQMIYTQRPGAGQVASRREWANEGRMIRPGAIPILVLRPMGPIEHVFEQLDTDPQTKREPESDAFAAVGELAPGRLEKLIKSLAKPTKRHLTVCVFLKPFGANLAGWIIGNAIPLTAGPPLVGKPAGSAKQGSTWDITVNLQLSETEQFVTLLHELGHLFCGHLGAFSDNNLLMEEFGWPSRQYLPHAAMEIEAELVAWWLANREGLTTGSPVYLRPYLEQAGDAVSLVDLDRVTRAVARVRGYLGDKH